MYSELVKKVHRATWMMLMRTMVVLYTRSSLLFMNDADENCSCYLDLVISSLHDWCWWELWLLFRPSHLFSSPDVVATKSVPIHSNHCSYVSFWSSIITLLNHDLPNNNPTNSRLHCDRPNLHVVWNLPSETCTFA